MLPYAGARRVYALRHYADCLPRFAIALLPLPPYMMPTPRCHADASFATAASSLRECRRAAAAAMLMSLDASLPMMLLYDTTRAVITCLCRHMPCRAQRRALLPPMPHVIAAAIIDAAAPDTPLYA